MSKFDWSNGGKTFNQNSGNRSKLSDSVEVVEYPKKGYGAYRFMGNPRGTAMHWLTTLAKPKPGEKKARLVSFPKVCLGLDPDTMEIDASKCPYCSMLEHNPRIELRQNVIDRKLQENEPRNTGKFTKLEAKLSDWNDGKFHIKEGKDIGKWTPVRVLTITPAVGNGITEITSLNTHKTKDGTKKAFGPEHLRFGFDVMIKYDKDASSPSKMYLVQKGDINPLTEEEKEYPIWDIPEHSPEDEKTAEKEAKRIKPYLTNREGELLFPDAKSESKSKKKNNYKDEFDEDEDMEEDDDDDRSSKKSKSKSKLKKWDDDDDDESDEDSEDEDSEDEEDEDEEDEDERPSKKSKSKAKEKSSSKSKSKDWDDDDADDDDDDDDDDEPPFDVDDEDDEEDEDEDERPSRSKLKSKSKSKSKSKPKSKMKSKRNAAKPLKIKLKR